MQRMAHARRDHEQRRDFAERIETAVSDQKAGDADKRHGTKFPRPLSTPFICFRASKAI